jgi:hypothetical protein
MDTDNRQGGITHTALELSARPGGRQQTSVRPTASEVLRSGYQRQRITAALELALMRPEPLFKARARLPPAGAVEAAADLSAGGSRAGPIGTVPALFGILSRLCSCGGGVRVLDVDHAEGDVVGRFATEPQRHEPGVATIPGGKDVRELVVGDRAVEAVAAKPDPILRQFNSVRRVEAAITSASGPRRRPPARRRAACGPRRRPGRRRSACSPRTGRRRRKR